MVKGGGNKKRYQYCTDSSGTILYLRALQGHSGRNLTDPSSQDNVLIPNDFFEYIYHVGCAGRSKFEQTTVSILFCLCILWIKNTKILRRSTWKHRVLLGISRKCGRNIKTRCIGSTSNLLKRKD